MRWGTRLGLSALAGVVVVGRAAAGLLDGQPPALGPGISGTIVYRMGAIHFEPGGWVDTTVTCTNLTSTPAIVALEVFDENDQVAGALAKATVAANGAVRFATSGEAGADAVTVPGLPPIDHGKARVTASTTQLACTGLHRIRGADGSIKEAPLELVKKVAF